MFGVSPLLAVRVRARRLLDCVTISSSPPRRAASGWRSAWPSADLDVRRARRQEGRPGLAAGGLRPRGWLVWVTPRRAAGWTRSRRRPRRVHGSDRRGQDQGLGQAVDDITANCDPQRSLRHRHDRRVSPRSGGVIRPRTTPTTDPRPPAVRGRSGGALPRSEGRAPVQVRLFRWERGRFRSGGPGRH